MQIKQRERDSTAILHILQKLKANLKNTFSAKDKISVAFYPEPNESYISTTAERLSIDLGKLTVQERKRKVPKLDSIFSASVSQLYSGAVKAAKFPGSDIWEFMKDKATRCIEPSKYRNMLIILTDGFMFDQNHKEREGKTNRYSYIEKEYSHFKDILKDNSKFEKDDYGFICKTKNLSQLEMMVIGAPQGKSYDVLKLYWEKWMTEMGVTKYAFEKSELPNETKKAIDHFFGY